MGVRSSWLASIGWSALASIALTCIACGRTERQRHTPTHGAGGAPDPADPPPAAAPQCAVRLAAHDARYCAVYQDDSIWCWGAASELGPRDFVASSKPVRVELPPAKEIVLGPRHSCAYGIDSEPPREIWCWGDNDHGQLGSVEGTAPRRVVTHDYPIFGLGLGETQTCFVDALFDVFCWGEDGDGTRSRSTQLTEVSDYRALFPAGTLIATDYRGRAHDFTRWDAPAALRSLGAGNHWVGVGTPTCVVKNSGSFWCTGDGPSPSAELLAMTEPRGIVTYAGIGELFVCALTIEGRVWCEGLNAAGQLGRGVSSSFEAGDYVAGLDDVRDLAVGQAGACALTGDGSVHCWGAYAEARASNAPVAISGCEAQAREPLGRSVPFLSDDARLMRLGEAGRARGQAACRCSFPGTDEESRRVFAYCARAADPTPNPICLAALEPPDARDVWDCRADQLWQEADCLATQECRDGVPVGNCAISDCDGEAKLPQVARYCSARRDCEPMPEAEAFAGEASVPSKSQLCDGFVDCVDGSDELNCTPGDATFHCVSGGDVAPERLCDGVSDCEDGSDEGCL